MCMETATAHNGISGKAHIKSPLTCFVNQQCKPHGPMLKRSAHVIDMLIALISDVIVNHDSPPSFLYIVRSSYFFSLRYRVALEIPRAFAIASLLIPCAFNFSICSFSSSSIVCVLAANAGKATFLPVAAELATVPEQLGVGLQM